MMKLFRLLAIANCLLASSNAFSPAGGRQIRLTPAATATATATTSTTTTTALNVAGIQEAWTAYNDALVTDPLLVKSVTAGVILGAADVAGQALEAKQKGTQASGASIDIARTARFAFFGLVLQAPWNHFYYQFLDGAIPPTVEPWTATTGIKVAIDQFVQAPVFTVLIFAFLGFLEGKNLEAVQKQLNDDYADTMVANCK